MNTFQKSGYVFLVLILSVFLSETIIMYLLPLFGIRYMLEAVIIDSILLVIFIFLPLYYFVYKPFVKQTNELRYISDMFKKLNRQNELILRSAGEGIFGLDIEGRVIFVNPSAAKMLGYTENELIGEHHHEKVHHSRKDGSTYPIEECPIYAACKDGIAHHGTDEVFWKKDGSKIPIEYFSNPIIEDGRLTGAVVTFRDITEKITIQKELDSKICQLEFLWTAEKKAEEAKKESQKMYSALFRDSRDAIFVTNKEGFFIDANQSTVDLLGYTLQELYNMSIYSFFSADADVERFKDAILSAGSLKDYDLKIITRDGKERNCLISASLRVNDEGDIVGYHGILHDITEYKLLETQLLHAQKLEAIGQLAGGVAHDFNNILTAISGFASLLVLDFMDNEQINYYAKQILDSVDKASSLTRKLLSFSRKQPIELKPLNLNDVVVNIEKILSRIIGEDIELKISIADRDLIIMGDASQIDQVIMNLATNSRDAMPNGGRITISTSFFKIDDEFIKTHGFGVNGDYALLLFEDNGIGMDEVIKDRIFEPFFTTKEVGKGTGLGLSIVYGVVKQHNGYINVYSEPNKGTIFKIYLPLINAEYEREEQSAISYASYGDETILIAEDDPQIRDFLKRLLEGFGYKTMIANDGEEAVRLYKEYMDDISLLLFDVMMPKKDGREAYDEIKQINPDVKVIFSSGYKTDILYKKGISDNDVNFVFKPISPNELLFKIRNVLDS